MKNIYILKIGGSVATQKNRKGLFLRKSLLEKVAKSIMEWKNENPNTGLVLIHGAGGHGHYLAKKYGLIEGTGADSEKIKGAVLSRIANQKLDLMIFGIFAKAGMTMVPVHSGSVIVQKDKKIKSFHFDILKNALKNNYVPMLYGEMVFDEKLGMSVCSGDAIAAFLAKDLKVEKVFFATDVDGVFDKDPHLHANAKLINSIKLKDVYSENIKLDESHSTDVTGGLRGKIDAFKGFFNISSLKEIVVFNGRKGENYRKSLNGENDLLTNISLK